MSSLIDLIFFSEKEKNLLVQLANGPMDINEIKEVLHVNSCALMPQIKKTERYGYDSAEGKYLPTFGYRVSNR